VTWGEQCWAFVSLVDYALWRPNSTCWAVTHGKVSDKKEVGSEHRHIVNWLNYQEGTMGRTRLFALLIALATAGIGKNAGALPWAFKPECPATKSFISGVTSALGSMKARVPVRIHLADHDISEAVRQCGEAVGLPMRCEPESTGLRLSCDIYATPLYWGQAFACLTGGR